MANTMTVRHYGFAQLRYLLGRCQILSLYKASLLVSEKSKIAIASATVRTQSEILL